MLRRTITTKEQRRFRGPSALAIDFEQFLRHDQKNFIDFLGNIDHFIYKLLKKWFSSLAHFSQVLRFTQKPVIWLVVQIKWLVSLWNAKKSWNGLNGPSFTAFFPCVKFVYNVIYEKLLHIFPDRFLPSMKFQDVLNLNYHLSNIDGSKILN